MVTSLRALGLAVLALLLPACFDDVGQGSGGSRTRPLAAPGDLTASSVGAFRIRLSWVDRSTLETRHRIDVHTAPFDANTAAVVDVVYLPADATGLDYDASPNRTLYFRVLALTESLESDPSNTASASTPPSAPTPYGLMTGPVTAGEIALAWTVFGSQPGIRVERTADGGASWTGIYDGGFTSSFSDSGLLAGKEYGYRVFSRDAYGLSLPSIPAWDVTQSTDWTLTTLTSLGGTLGTQTAVAFRNGVEYVTHHSYPGADVMLTTGSVGGIYSTRAVDNGGAGVTRGFDGTAIALDAAGAWHAAACEYPGKLRYVTSSVSGTIDAVGDTGHMPRIAVSSVDGSIQIVHLERPGTLKRAIKRGTAVWTTEIVAVTEMIAFRPSFVLDPAGKAHVLFAEWTAGSTVQDLVYATQEGSGPWILERSGWGAIVGGQSLALDPAGIPHVAYLKPDPGSAKYGLFLARRSGGAWVSEPVHVKPGQSVEYPPALSIGGDGLVHLAYQELVHQDLRYARRAPGQPWTYRVLDTGGSVGWDLSMVAAEGLAHVAYHDLTNGDLKRAVGGP